jgi:uncharacterized protein with PIN domain
MADVDDKREYDPAASYALCPYCGRELTDGSRYGEATAMMCFPCQRAFWKHELPF